MAEKICEEYVKPIYPFAGKRGKIEDAGFERRFLRREMEAL